MNDAGKKFKEWWDDMILWDTNSENITASREQEMFQFFVASGYLLHLKQKYKDRAAELMEKGLISE